MEPYEVIATYPETGVRTILVRGASYDVQSLTPISEEEWTVRMQDLANSIAAKSLIA